MYDSTEWPVPLHFNYILRAVAVVHYSHLAKLTLITIIIDKIRFTIAQEVGIATFANCPISFAVFSKDTATSFCV